jgi:hypothetical protein
MNKFSALGGVALLVVACQAHALTPLYELPQVTVTGNAIQPVPPGATWAEPLGASPGNYLPDFNFLVQLSNLLQAAKLIKDVRCTASGDRKFITSRSDNVERSLAAIDVANKIRTATGLISGAVLGKVKNPLDGKTYLAFEVTYADGGTEKWMLQPAPTMSNPIFDMPLPNSLNLSDGVVRPNQYCPW